MGFFRGHVERRTSKNRFFKQVDVLINWALIERELKKVYKKGLKERGAKAYGPLPLFQDAVGIGLVRSIGCIGGGDGQRESVGDALFGPVLGGRCP